MYHEIARARQVTAGYEASVERVFGHALKGFTVKMSAATASRLADDPRIDYIEEDGIVWASTTQSNATWGLDRIDQRSLPLSGTFTYTNTGSGVNAYIIDTGILRSQWFGGRAVTGSCDDWFAPGVGITSAWYTSNTATNTISGTSMAAPHAAGVAALYLQSNTGASPQQVRDALYNNTTKGIVTSSSTANNHLLFTNY